MRVLDLFSGVGGLTHALRGLVGIDTVAYCEIDDTCRKVLDIRMEDGSLPRGPVFRDVTELTAEEVGGCDAIIGGFPCVGFSVAGKRQGLENTQSHLVYHIIRLVRDIRPSFVFMENVQTILKHKDEMRALADEFAGMGYDMRWICVSAEDVGALHLRARWYALCTRRDASYPDIVVRPGFARHDWTREPVVPRMVTGRNRYEEARYAMMGNSVVPDGARAAFLHLWNGFRDCSVIPDIFKIDRVPYHTPLAKRRVPEDAIQLPKCGGFEDGEFVVYRLPKKGPRRPQVHIVIDPAVFGNNTGNCKTFHRWMSPRYGCPRPSTNLSDRNGRDLATQVRFEVSTDDATRSGRVNGHWVEWLMGFPLGWTAF